MTSYESILSRLPEVVLSSVLSDWTVIRDLGRMDSATTNRALRTHLLQCFQLIKLSFDKSQMLDYNSQGLFRWIVLRNIKLTKITLFPPTVSRALVWQACAQSGPHIRELYCIDSSSHDHDLKQVSELCANLKHLNIHYCENIANEGVFHLTKSCVSLTCIEISFSRTISDELLFGISQHCRSLEALSIRWCIHITERGIIQVMNSCAALRYLELPACDITRDITTAMLSRDCSSLTYLDISSCKHITDLSLHTIAVRCSNLQHLDIAHNQQVTEAGLSTIAQSCIYLVHLDISYCCRVSGVSFQQVSSVTSSAGGVQQCLSQLEYLNTRWCKAVDDGGLCSLVAALKSSELTEVLNISKLRVLNISNCHQITDASLTQIIASCSCSLQHLDISCCNNVTDSLMNAMSCKEMKLTYVNMSWCRKMTENALRKLAAACKQLSHLDISYCEHIRCSDSSIARIFEDCHSFNELVIIIRKIKYSAANLLVWSDNRVAPPLN